METKRDRNKTMYDPNAALIDLWNAVSRTDSEHVLIWAGEFAWQRV
jgi:hypothetical protein